MPEEAQNAFCSVGVVNVNVSNVCLHAVKKLQKCTKLPPCGVWDTEGCVEMECRPPVGRGRVDCVADDPICGADNSSVTCLLPPPPVENVTNVTEPPTEADLRAAAAQAALDAREEAAQTPKSLLRHRRTPASVRVEHIAKKISSAMSGLHNTPAGNKRERARAKGRWLRRVSARPRKH